MIGWVDVGAWRRVLLIFFLAIFFLSASFRAETPEKRAFLCPNPPSDLRADPGVEHQFSSNLTHWASAQRESVRQRSLKLVAEAAAQSTEANSSKIPGESKEATRKTAPTAPGKAKTPEPRSKASSLAKSAAPVDSSQEQEKVAKSPSILQMLEGHETELMIAAAIAAAFFLIGWICGGHYSLRRDRRRRTKIRF
jgi:hypothetical protein